MNRTLTRLGILLVIALLSTGVGCARLHHLPDHCADCIYQCELARAFHHVCSSQPYELGCGSGCGCGIQVYDEVVVVEEPRCYQDSLPCLPRVQPGPPPIPYEPPLPSKFLPVPTRSVFSPLAVPISPDINPEHGGYYGPHLVDPLAN